MSDKSSRQSMSEQTRICIEEERPTEHGKAPAEALPDNFHPAE